MNSEGNTNNTPAITPQLLFHQRLGRPGSPRSVFKSNCRFRKAPKPAIYMTSESIEIPDEQVISMAAF